MAKLRILFSFLWLWPASFVFATATYYDSMGLKDRYWMVQKSYPYIFTNPSYAAYNSGKMIIEWNEASPFGGILLATDSGALGVFGGKPTSNLFLNSATSPSGMYSMAFGDYFPITKVSPGSNLDSAATATLTSSGQFGNLSQRVNALLDPGINQLKNNNIGFMAATGLGKGALGVLIEYGWATEMNQFRGIVEEELALKKSQTRFNVGFSGSPDSKKSFFDIQASLTLYKINNYYRGTAKSSEQVDGSYESDGSFDFAMSLRFGYSISKTQFLILHSSVLLNDTSSTLRSHVRGGDFSGALNIAENVKDTFSRNGQVLSTGISDEISLGNATKIIMGVDFVYKNFLQSFDGRDYKNQTYQVSPYLAQYRTFQVPLILGMQTFFTQKFSIRMGIVHSLLPVNFENTYIEKNYRKRVDASFAAKDAGETYYEMPHGKGFSELSIGFSYQWSEIRFDWLSGLELVRAGPQFLSGAQNQFSMGFSVTAFYEKTWAKM